MTYLFQSAQVDVVAVSESAAALDEFVSKTNSEGEFDLIALDIRMPHINGNELARRIREQGYKGAMVALSANTSNNECHLNAEDGFNYYFEKNQINKKILLALL